MRRDQLVDYASAYGRSRNFATLRFAPDTAQTVEDMDIPGFRLHSLGGSRKGRWSIWVNANWRLTFAFENGNVHVLDYEDYH